MAEIKMKEGLEGVEFFGDVDKVNGKVGSEYPAYYYTQQTQELKDLERRLQFDLDQGAIPERGKPAAIAELKKVRSKIEGIESSRPDVDAIADTLSKAAKGLGKKIQEVMPSRVDLQRGVVDAHEEYRRDSEPCIRLEGDEMILAKKMGCFVSRDGEVSRNDASKIWKISKKLLGENSDVETLRR